MAAHRISHAKQNSHPKNLFQFDRGIDESNATTLRTVPVVVVKTIKMKSGNNVVEREREKSRINYIISASLIFKQRAPCNSILYKSSERIKIFNVWVSGYHFCSPPHSPHTFSAHNVISIKNVEWSRCSVLHCGTICRRTWRCCAFFRLFRHQCRCWSVADRNECQFQRAYLSTLK